MGSDSDDNKLVFFKDTFCRWMVTALGVSILACVICQAPELSLTQIGSFKSPIQIDAIRIILVAPICLVLVSFLLWRLADQSKIRASALAPPDRTAMTVVIGLFALAHLFLWSRFFLLLAPAGASPNCAERVGFGMLVRSFGGETQSCHVMSSAKAINPSAWYFVNPVPLQAWGSTLLVIVALYFLLRVWRCWNGPGPLMAALK
jgi:hypothetical protein